MNIDTNKIEDVLNPEFVLGDLFQHADGKDFYLLTQSNDVFLLASMNGDDGYSESVSLQVLRDTIKEEVGGGELKHFPRSAFKLTLETA